MRLLYATKERKNVIAWNFHIEHITFYYRFFEYIFQRISVIGFVGTYLYPVGELVIYFPIPHNPLHHLARKKFSCLGGLQSPTDAIFSRF